MILSIITFIFGRIYCSVLCPLGIMQDLISRLGKRDRFRFRPPKSLLRISILLIFIVSFIIGIPLIYGILEPYSSFGRIAANLIRPLGITSSILFKNDTLPLWNQGSFQMITAFITFAVISVLTLRSGRSWCNTVCPVGTVLGILNRFSLFSIDIDYEKCVNCGQCYRNCKSSCIDMEKKTIDSSRCVTCFNCIDRCGVKAISYDPVWKKKIGSSETSLGRRSFILTSLGISIIPLFSKNTKGIFKEQSNKNHKIITPPGSKSYGHLSENCTGCQLCVMACPNNVLITSDGGNILQPQVSYKEGYCKIDCTVCSETCPTGAILEIQRNGRKRIQVGKASLNWEKCIINKEKKECKLCSDICPTKSVSLIGAPGLSRWLAVMPESCIGCGGCEHTCPVSAIQVIGNTEHRIIKT